MFRTCRDMTLSRAMSLGLAAREEVNPTTEDRQMEREGTQGGSKGMLARTRDTQSNRRLLLLLPISQTPVAQRIQRHKLGT